MAPSKGGIKEGLIQGLIAEDKELTEDVDATAGRPVITPRIESRGRELSWSLAGAGTLGEKPAYKS